GDAGGGDALLFQIGDSVVGGGRGGEGRELEVEGSGAAVLFGALGGDGIGEFLLDAGEGLVGLWEFAHALLADAGAIEGPSFDVGAVEIFAGVGPLADGGGIVVLEVGDVGETGADVGIKRLGRDLVEGLDVIGAGLLEVFGDLLGGFVARGIFSFEGAALEVVSLGGLGAMGCDGEDLIGAGHGVVVLFGFEGGEAGVEDGLRIVGSRLGLLRLGGAACRQSQN